MNYDLEKKLETIDYDDVEKLKELLIGQRIVSVNRTTESKIVKKLRETGDGNEFLYYSSGRGEYGEVIEYLLSGGATLRAHAHDGGCACSNGCFSVKLSEEDERRLIGATILGVRSEERSLVYRENQDGDWDYLPKGEPIVDGKSDEYQDRDGSAEIKIFVYTELQPQGVIDTRGDGTVQTQDDLEEEMRVPLVTSEGGDNGYYGWGFTFSVDRTITVQEDRGNRVEVGERRGIEAAQ